SVVALRPTLRLFFSSACGALAALHSFPTRRSSDLAPLGPSIWVSSRSTPEAASTRRWRRSWRSFLKRCSGSADGRPTSHYRDVRSEEHTSELQSRENLVCRLLLEKKKQYITRLKPN